MSRSAAQARLKRRLAIPGPRRLEWYHSVGGLVPQCLPSRPKHGDYFAQLEELVDSFESGASSRESRKTTLRGVLDNSKAFHQAYSAAEVRRLESPPAESHRLTWNHLRILVRVPAADRERIQRAAIKGKWSSARLMQELRQMYARKNPGGRRSRFGKFCSVERLCGPLTACRAGRLTLPEVAAQGPPASTWGRGRGASATGWLAG